MKSRLKLILWLSVVLSGISIAAALAQNSMSDFGLKADELETQLVEALVNGYIPTYPDKKVFKAASPSMQAAFVRTSLAWFKNFTESDAFKADYAQKRETARPSAPQAVSADDQYAADMAEQRAGLEKMRQDIAKMPPEMQKQMQSVLKEMEAEIEKSANDQKMTALIKQGYEEENKGRQRDYEKQLVEWQTQYPEDPKAVIASRLRQFMTLSADVAYHAELIPDPQGGNLMKFADPQYEDKSREWKLCYRAGREPVQAARVFVSEWLNKIEKK